MYLSHINQLLSIKGKLEAQGVLIVTQLLSSSEGAPNWKDWGVHKPTEEAQILSPGTRPAACRTRPGSPGGSSSWRRLGPPRTISFDLTLLPLGPHPWSSFELNVIGGKQLRGHGQRLCWPGSKVGPPRSSSQKRRQTIGGGGTTPSSTPSWPGVPAGRTHLLLTDS